MAQFDFREHAGELLLRYEPDANRGTDWIHNYLREGKPVGVRGAFHFDRQHLIEEPPERSRQGDDEINDDEPESVTFRVAVLRGDYFEFDKDILGLDVDLLIHKDVPLSIKMFAAERNISIFRRIAELRLGRIVIGGDDRDAIPITEFQRLLVNFPTSTELRKYVLARVSAVVRQYVETKVDGEVAFEKYLSRRVKQDAEDIKGQFARFEVQKYRFLHEKLTSMLASEQKYTERVWQDEILQIILLLNPKYIKTFKEAPVKDTYRNAERSIDFLLVDASGHIDIVEIKKPFDQSIVSATQYRDNFIPMRELSGAVMQVEKYLFHLNKSGKAGEDRLTKKYRAHLPEGFEIKITNPGGMIIMGRDNNLSADQRHDFEVVRRKYKNVIDIITYDELLRRLDFVVKQLEKEVAT